MLASQSILSISSQWSSSIVSDLRSRGNDAAVLRDMIVSGEMRRAPFRWEIYAAIEVSGDNGGARRVQAHAAHASIFHNVVTLVPACETDEPRIKRCPPYILEVLSDTDDEKAMRWREECRLAPYEYLRTARKVGHHAYEAIVTIDDGTGPLQLERELARDVDGLMQICRDHATIYPRARWKPFLI